MRYFAAAKRRRLCQLHGEVWEESVDAGDLFGTDGDANPYDYALGDTEVYSPTASPQEDYQPLDDNYSNTELEVEDTDYEYADIDLLSAMGENTEAAAPVVDRCCGHRPDAKPFASAGEKSCCNG